ncbi:MAG TPA: hypothetical protein PKD91_02160 [Bacteroidia bacterium]|nr:hypothetical protein [Bacteroidia bacterium]
MGLKFPPNFPIALTLLVLVIIGAIFSFSKNSNKKADIVEDIHVETAKIIPADSFYFNLESQVMDLENFETVRAETSNSAKHSCSMDAATEFSVAFSRSATTIKEFGKHKQVTYSFSIFAPKPVNNAQVVYSLSSEEGGDSDWQSKELKCDSSSWTRYDFKFDLNEEFRKGSGKVKLYVWNKGKETFLIDDISIIFN